MNTDWRIAPRHGIGRLAFGLSPEDVASMAPLYGEPSPLVSNARVPSDVEDVIAQFGASLPPEVIAALRGAVQELITFSSQTLVKGSTPILLEYRDSCLDGVTVEAQHKEAHFEGRPVFALSAPEVLRLFERADGAPGRYRSDEAAFDNLAVALYCFSATSHHGEVHAMSEANPNFQKRSVTLRREPYRLADDPDQGMTFSFD